MGFLTYPSVVDKERTNYVLLQIIDPAFDLSRFISLLTNRQLTWLFFLALISAIGASTDSYLSGCPLPYYFNVGSYLLFLLKADLILP